MQVWLQPDLQKVRGLARRMVELAVYHAAACAHALHVAGRNGGDVAQVVLVRQLAREHVADDFHVAVAVAAKAGAGGDVVLVDHAQVAKAHVQRIVVMPKRKAVVGAQPAVVGIAPVL